MKEPKSVCLVLSLFVLSCLLPASLGACDVSGAKPPPPLTVEMLKNSEYPSEWTEKDLVTLEDGEYREEYMSGGMRLTNRVWLKLHALGDLNDDGAEDAAVILLSNSGGSGSLVTLVAVLNDGGTPRSVDATSLGMSTDVKSMTIESGEITLKVLTQGTNDPNCCPTVEDTLEYELQGDALVATRLPPQGMETESPRYLAFPIEGMNITGLQPEPPWLIIDTSFGLWVANMDGSNPVLLISEASGLRSIQGVNNLISSPAHQIAVVTSERKDDRESWTLQTISLPDGQLHQLTGLTPSGIELLPNGHLPGDMESIGQLAWSPDGRKLAFIGALDEPKADVYVYGMDTGKIQRVSQDDGKNTTPTWSPDGKSILYYGENGLSVAAADGSGNRLLNITAPGSNLHDNNEWIRLLGWRDHETAVIMVGQLPLHMGQLRLYNILTEKQTVLNQGDLVDNAVVATGLKEDAGTILYDDPDDGLYLLSPNNVDPLKLDGEPTWTIRWDEQGRSFIILWEGPQSNMCTLMADGSHQLCAPFGSPHTFADVRTFGLIWGWTCTLGENTGVWISGPGLETLHILDQPANSPIWNTDNDLLFFVGSTLYRTTFDSHYTDVAPIASFGEDEINKGAWMGWEEALAKKYGP